MVVHTVLVVAAFAACLKGLAFLWCFLPAMTGLYPVVGVSLAGWCDCLNYREEVMQQAQGVNAGRQKFMQNSMH